MLITRSFEREIEQLPFCILVFLIEELLLRFFFFLFFSFAGNI